MAPPRPLLIKNGGPGPYLVALPDSAVQVMSGMQDNQLGLLGEMTFSIKSSSGGATNVHLQGQLVRVWETNGSLYLSNRLAGPATNYFLTSGGYFDGDEVVTLNTSSSNNFWKTFGFWLSQAAFDNDQQMESLLMILGAAQQGVQDYEVAASFAVTRHTSDHTAFTNACNVILGVPLDKVRPGATNSFNIFASRSTNLPSTMALRAYLAKVEKTTATNGGNVSTNFALVPISPNLNTNYFQAGPGLYVGTNTVQLVPGGAAHVSFALREEAFEDDEIEDCLIAFVGLATNSFGRSESAIIFPVASRFSLKSKSAEKK